MKKNTEVERCTVEVREKQDEGKNKSKTKSEKISEKLQISLVLCTFLGRMTPDTAIWNPDFRKVFLQDTCRRLQHWTEAWSFCT